MSDSRLEKIDPLERMFMFQGWLSDQEQQIELAKNTAYLLGSFWNPEAVKQLMGGDVGGSYRSTDEDLERSTEIVRRAAEGAKQGRRRRRVE